MGSTLPPTVHTVERTRLIGASSSILHTSIAGLSKALFVAGILLVALPWLAVGRGIWALLWETNAQDTTAWIGISLSLIALVAGALFFAYSVRYYLGTITVLLLSRSDSVRRQEHAARTSRNGRGNGHANGNGEAANGVSVIAHLGNGNGYRTANGDAGESGSWYGPPWGSVDPFVSIHIAAYNEKRVIERLLTACAELDYSNFEVIVVDDSTDESMEILKPWRNRDRFKIGHRARRDGYKGGALAEALKVTDPRTRFVVVFDADSVPFPDSIQRLLSFFYTNDEGGPRRLRDQVAAVQSYQWHVLNKSESWLTEAIRASYSGSYMVERPFEEAVGAMKMVAGTAYMIRADVLRTLGWGRSITEDWELTLRLYKAGWKVVYTPFAETPAECVSTFPRLVRQRMRWAEGHTYNVRRHFDLLLSPRISISEKVEFLFYSTYYLQAVFFVVGTVAWLLAELGLRTHIPQWTALLGWSLVFSNILSTPIMNAAGLLLEEAELKEFGGVFGALLVSYLLVPFQAWAALKGLFEREEGPWFRTPKTGRITDPIRHLRGLGRLRLRALVGGGRRPEPAAVPALRFTPLAPRSAARVGWVVLAALLLTFGGLAVGASHAPIAYASPDQLFLRSTASIVNPADQTLAAQGTSTATLAMANGSAAAWLTSTTYPGGSAASGTYVLKLDWSANGCEHNGGACNVTITWGYCNGGCLTLQPAAATFTFTLNDVSGVSGTASQSVTGAPITLAGCPCHFYVLIRTSGASLLNL